MDYCAVQKEENLGKSRIPFFTDELYAAELSELERFLCQDVNLCSIYLSHNGLGVFNVQSTQYFTMAHYPMVIFNGYYNAYSQWLCFYMDTMVVFG